MILTEKEKKRQKRNERIIATFIKLKADGDSNNKVIGKVADKFELDKNWVYRILKKAEAI